MSNLNDICPFSLKVLSDLIVALHLVPNSDDEESNANNNSQTMSTKEDEEEENKENIIHIEEDKGPNEAGQVICSQPVQSVEFPGPDQVTKEVVEKMDEN